MELPKHFDHKTREPELYKQWEEAGFFNPDRLPGERKTPFTVIMPPPNANGSLHIGHALFVTTQDIMIRYKRLAGFKTLWLPGADHAGFETQVVYTKKLEKEGRKFWELPREQLYGEIKDFTLANKAFMEGQLKALGASADWSREKFTLDEDIRGVVYETFKMLYDDDLIYRGNRIINWCSKHQTSLSDLEIAQPEVADKLYYLQYGPFTIATARPETKFADKYIIVHPEDKRYAQYADRQEFQVEWINGPIKATLIKDPMIDMTFGTGAMTITPWHSSEDFDLAQKYKLPVEQIIDWTGKLLPIAGEFAGQHISKARAAIVEKLNSKGLLVKVDEYKHSVPVCYKCNTAIEPQVRLQWFIAMTKEPKRGGKSLRDLAVDAVQSGEVTFTTERFKADFLRWMENLRDWNISRQIVWGIRIPAWFDIFDPENAEGILMFDFDTGLIEYDKELRQRLHEETVKDYFIGREGPSFKDQVFNQVITTCSFDQARLLVEWGKISLDDLMGKINKVEISRCKKPLIGTNKIPSSAVQDPDVFDTWFSSGQWPFATLMTTGKKDFETFYPTDVMETGWDILFFWVARMVMFGLYRTGKAPFKTVYLHGLVRDKERQKMSKSKGNVIDPLGVSGEYGTDAVRMALVSGNAAGTDPVISEDKIRGYRNFTTKLWNMAKFLLQYSDSFDQNDGSAGSPQVGVMQRDEEVLHELEKVKKEVTSYLDEYKLHLAAESIYHYTWHTVADKLIEEYKPRLNGTDEADKTIATETLMKVFSECLKMLHPFMPFVTEEIWGVLPAWEGKTALIVESW